MSQETFFRSRFPKGHVNNATLVSWSNGEKHVYVHSPTLSPEALQRSLPDAECCGDVNVRQILISPYKFKRAKKLSEHLIYYDFKVAEIIRTSETARGSSAFLRYIDGPDGDEVLNIDFQNTWEDVGQMLARLHSLPIPASLSENLSISIEEMESSDWLACRYEFLIARMAQLGAKVNIDAAVNAGNLILDSLQEIEDPIRITYDDAKPSSLIYNGEDHKKPTLIDLEALTVGHRIIDGVGRALYWGPVGIPRSEGKSPNYEAADHVLQGYNKNVPNNWRIDKKEVNNWLIATELFWLPDIVSIKLLLENDERSHSTQRRIKNFNRIVEAVNQNKIEYALSITLQ
jgi:hypothetical protein